MTEKLSALKNGDFLAFVANKDPKCPHCGDDFDITDNEARFLYDDNGPHRVECRRCDNEFQVNSIARWTFSTDEQDDDE